MTRLKLNPEYAKRHLFVTLLMVALGCWFGYDGFIGYPATPAAELYKSIEGSDAPEGFDLDAFKRQKIGTQYGFTILAFFAAAVVGSRLAKSKRFKFGYTDDCYVYHGRRHPLSSIKKIDRSKWEKKGIVKIDGITLDSWHHLGVKEFVEKVDSTLASNSAAETAPPRGRA